MLTQHDITLVKLKKTEHQQLSLQVSSSCPLKKYKGIYINGIIMASFMLIRKMHFLLNNRNVFRVIPTIH